MLRRNTNQLNLCVSVVGIYEIIFAVLHKKRYIANEFKMLGTFITIMNYNTIVALTYVIIIKFIFIFLKK